jgi:hypothetical protein
MLRVVALKFCGLCCWCDCAVASRNSLPYGGCRNRGRNWLPHGSFSDRSASWPSTSLAVVMLIDRSGQRFTVPVFRAGNVDMLQ